MTGEKWVFLKVKQGFVILCMISKINVENNGDITRKKYIRGRSMNIYFSLT